MVNCLWIGTPEYSFYGVRAQATTTALGTARPEILVESSYVEGVDRIWTMTATGIDGPVISEDVKGVIAEANCNLDDHSRVDTEKNGDAAVFKSDLTWCVPYSYWRMDPFDCNHVTDVKEGAGAPWVGPSMAPTPLSLPPLATISWCPPYEYSLIDPTSETEVDRIKAAAGAPVDTSTATPTAGPTPQPAGAPPTDDSTHAPTAEPTPQACDSPEKFYPDTDHNLADEGSGPDGWKLTSEHSQKNPYSVVGFAAWADAGIAYGGFYGGDEVTCYDADCIKDALEKKSPLIIHLGQDIDLEDARYKIKGDKDHDDKTLEGHGFTLKYSGDDGEAPLFTDNGASNLVFRHVRFENTGEDSPAIQVRETSHHVVLDQCTFACSEPGKCGYAVTVEAPATFVTIQRCLFDQVKKGIRVRNKGDDNGAGRLTVVECYFRNCEKESPDAEVGWIHMASNVVEGGGDGDGMIKTDPEKGGVPELLVDGGRLSVAEGKLYKKSGGGLIAAVPGVTNSNPEAPDAPEDLSWCVPYDYTPIDGFDDAAVETLKQNAGAHPDEPGSEPTGEPTAEPTARPSSEPTGEPTAEPIPRPTIKPTTTPTPLPTAEPTATSTPAPTPAPTTPSPTSPAPTPYPTTPLPTLSCDSPEKFYPNTPNQNGDGYKLISEHSQMNPYNVTGFAAWADAGIAYGGFYGGNEVTCHDAKCLEEALIETDGPLIIHLGKDIDLGDARYKIMGSKDHDDKTLEGHGFTLKYSFDDGGEAPLFTDAGASNLVIRNVRFENTGDTKERPAIQIRDGAHHVVLDQCTFTCSYAGECGYAVTVEAPATFVTIQRCLFDRVEKGIHMRNKAPGDNGAGRVTVVESYFRKCEKESPDGEVGWIHMASCVIEGGGDGDGMIKTDPDNGGVPQILVDGGRLSVAEGKLYRKDGGGLIAAVSGVTNSDPEAPDAPGDLSWCPPYDYISIDGFDDAAVEKIKENAGAQKEFPACGVRINRGRGQDQNDFQCVTDPKKMEHDGRKIAFACCTAHICTRKDEDGKCYAGHLKQQSNFAPKDWHEATRACAAEGKVLCGVEEPCSRSGCSYDHHYQWTGQECQAGDANFPYECLWPGSVKVVPGIKGVAPYCEKNQSALVRDDGTDMGIAFACCNEDGSSGCTRKVDGSCNLCGNQPVRVQRWSSSGCNAGDWRKEKGTWAPVSWADAMEHCATYGKTLCGSSDNARCQNRGCYYNNIYQWTNEQCEPPEPPPTCLVVAPITDSSECPDVCPPACKDVLVTGGQCSGDGVCAPDDQGVLCTCTPPSARRLLAEPKEEYVFDVTELGECVPCSGACEVGECVPDTRRRGLRFGMSTTGCCCGA